MNGTDLVIDALAGPFADAVERGLESARPQEKLRALADGFATVVDAVVASDDPRRTDQLLRRLQRNAASTADDLARVDDIGCRQGVDSQAAVTAVANDLDLLTSDIGDVVRSIDGKDIGDRSDDLAGAASDLAELGKTLYRGVLDLGFAAGDLRLGLQARWPQYSRPSDEGCGPKRPFVDVPSLDDLPALMWQPDMAEDAIDALATPIHGLVQTVGQVVAILASTGGIFSDPGCAEECEAFSGTVIAGPGVVIPTPTSAPADAITVAVKSLTGGTFDATVPLVWTLCCWNWCLFIFWDKFVESFFTTHAWVLRAGNIGAAQALAAAQLNNELTKAAPPKPSDCAGINP